MQGILTEANPKTFYERPVSDVMQEQFPIVDERLSVTAVALLLQHSQAVLTARRGKITGIITPSDLLSMSSGRIQGRRELATADKISASAPDTGKGRTRPRDLSFVRRE